MDHEPTTRGMGLLKALHRTEPRKSGTGGDCQGNSSGAGLMMRGNIFGLRTESVGSSHKDIK